MARGSIYTLAGLLVISGAMSGAVSRAQQPASDAPAQASAPTSVSSPNNEPWRKIAIPPLHPFKPAQPKRIVFPNGLVLLLQEDHELPFIDGSILIRGGSRDEPAAKIGLVSLYGETWRTGGSSTISGDALDDRMEAKAAHIETRGGLASTSISWSTPKAEFDTVLAATIDLLLHPAFKADKLELAKRQMDAGIARRNDDAGAIASRQAAQVVYGATSPYARQPEFRTVAAVTVEDLAAWHARTVVPNGMIVSVSGDFDSAAVEAKLRSELGSLPKGKLPESATPEFAGPKPGVYFVDKADVNQSNVFIVGLGTERNNPDLYALSVMNEIFSGGFGSRLVQDVRTKLGLAYSVNGSYGAAYDHPGMFRVGAGTRSVSTVAATKAMLAEIERLKTERPTPEELRNAKDQVLNSFIFNYDSPDKVLNEQVTLAFYGYPADYLEKYKAGVERVTAADVSRVARRYVDASKLAIVVVGNRSELTPPLTELGSVTTVDVSIPHPDGASKAAP